MSFAMASAIYVITYHKFNHEGEGRLPLDARFLNSNKNFIYYLIDESCPSPLLGKNVLFEKEIDPHIYQAGGRYFGEWSFLLAEAKHAFCSYPLFMTSSRFYEKNTWLFRDLNSEWDTLFSYFDHYDFGYLPSYDRNLRWISMEWEKKIEKKKHYTFFPFHKAAFHLIEELYQVKTWKEYKYTSDLFCNYIGFKDRESLLKYVNFYKTLINYFFTPTYEPKCDLSKYVQHLGAFRNEKPFTFFTELFSHLFFYKNNLKFFALHYDGYYQVDEKATHFRKLAPFPLPLSLKLEHYLRSKKRELMLDSCLAPVRHFIRSKILKY